MDHVVYLDASAKELDLLLSGHKTMLIRGAAGRKMPHGRVHLGDTLYLINNNAEGLIRARAQVKNAIHSDKLSEDQSVHLLETCQEQLRLTKKQQERWAGKRFLVLVEVSDVAEIAPFRIDKSQYGNMDDWLLVEQIENVRLKA